MAGSDSILDFLEPEQVALLRQRAREQGRDVLDVLRGIVADAVGRGQPCGAADQPPRKPRRVLDLAGIFDDGELTGADIDDYLYGENS